MRVPSNARTSAAIGAERARSGETITLNVLRALRISALLEPLPEPNDNKGD